MDKAASVDALRRDAAKFDGEALDLLVGQPYYAPPPSLSEALADAARQGSGEYGPPGGLPSLKEKLCIGERENGLDIALGNIVIGNGSKGLLFGLMSILPGDNVIVPTPAYPAMLAQPPMLGKQVVRLPLEAPFRLVANDLDRINVAGGILVVSSPSNPMGVSIELSQWSLILGRCRRLGMRLVVDEVYRELRFGGEAPDWGEIDPHLDTVVIVRSFSKSHGVCGWRLGYVLTNIKTAQALAKWQSTALNPPSTPVQRAFGAWLPGDNSRLNAVLDHYEQCAERFAEVLRGAGFVPVMPEGGLYVFADARGVAGQESTEALCARLAHSGVLLWPGEDFGAPGYVRLSYASISPGNVDQAVDLLRSRLRAAINS